MKATTEDWTLAEQRSARWRIAEQRAAVGDMNCQCLLDLRAGVETLEQRAPAPEPPPPPPANRPLWEVMMQARSRRFTKWNPLRVPWKPLAWTWTQSDAPWRP